MQYKHFYTKTMLPSGNNKWRAVAEPWERDGLKRWTDSSGPVTSISRQRHGSYWFLETRIIIPSSVLSSISCVGNVEKGFIDPRNAWISDGEMSCATIDSSVGRNNHELRRRHSTLVASRMTSGPMKMKKGVSSARLEILKPKKRNSLHLFNAIPFSVRWDCIQRYSCLYNSTAEKP